MEESTLDPGTDHTDELVNSAADMAEIAENPPTGKRRFVTVAIVVGVLILGAFLWRYLFSSPTDAETGAANDNPVVVAVRTGKAVRTTISDDVSSVGTIFAARQAVVGSNASGQIMGLRVLKNALVSKGDLLAKINTSDIEAQKREAETALHEARLNVQTLSRSTIPQSHIQAAKDLRDARASAENARNLYERRKILFDKGGIALKDVEAAQLTLTQAEDNLRFLEDSRKLRTGTSNQLDLQTAQARAAQAEQRIKTLQNQINLSEIRAPISGFVIEQTQFDGEYAASGSKILTIADVSEVIVKASFSDTVIPNLKQDDAVAVFPNDVPGERMTGKVSLISRSTDPQNRATEVWVNLANGRGMLRIGGAANVVVSENTQVDAVVVPRTAVVVDAANEKTGIVMVVDQLNIAHEKKVEVGVRTNQLVQIVTGLSGGETIIVEGNYGLPDGTRVAVTDAGTHGTGGSQ